MRPPPWTALAALLLAGCAGVAVRPPSATKPATAVSPERPLAELPVQDLASGQCGLVLWQRTRPPRRIFLAVNQPPEARIEVGGRVVRLGRTDMSGGIVYGHAPRQRFDGPDSSVEIDVAIEPRRGLVGGAVVTGGTLTYRRTGGDAVILPVYGLIGCEPG